MNVQQLKETILASNAKLMTVKFIKADGTERVMYAKYGVKRYLSKKANKRKVVNRNPDLIKVWDAENKAYRSFNVNSVISFSCGRIKLWNCMN